MPDIGKQKNGNYSGGYVVNHFSTAMQEDYEKRIKQLEETVKNLQAEAKPVEVELKSLRSMLEGLSEEMGQLRKKPN